MSYTENIINKLLKSNITINALKPILYSIIIIILRIHIDNIISTGISLFIPNNIYIIFLQHVTISSALVIYSNIFYMFLLNFDANITNLSIFIINNYLNKDIKRFKIYLNFMMCFYLYIIVSFIEINNNIIKLYIIEYITCYIITDIIYNKLYINREYYIEKYKYILIGKVNKLSYKTDEEIINENIELISRSRNISESNTFELTQNF